MAIKTSSAKNKGRKLQQHVRDRIYHYFPHLKEGDVESRGMGGPGVDVMLSPLAREACPLSFECKNTAVVPGTPDIDQATANKYKDTVPVVAWKPKGKQYKDTRVIVKLEDLLEFMQGVYEDKQPLEIDYSDWNELVNISGNLLHPSKSIRVPYIESKEVKDDND